GQELLDRGDRPAAMPLLDRAIAQFGEALRIVPSYELSLRKIARAYDLKGDHATALDYMKKASDLWPDDLTAALELAEALYNGGDFKASLAVLDQARRVSAHLSPRDLSHIYMDRGLVFDQGLGQPGRALYCFEKALELDPEHPQADEIRKTIVGLRARGLQPLPDDLREAPLAGAPRPPAATPEAPSGKAPASRP
ncbi:MAG TPA: tetratricopeptide repeat protein, partial [Candidatus Polarisedimenticolia bacterium]|nr:tetratricopeptide repeat protein [Candidatus Polarisedimenticolia bacterium]